MAWMRLNMIGNILVCLSYATRHPVDLSTGPNEEQGTPCNTRDVGDVANFQTLLTEGQLKAANSSILYADLPS